MLFAATAFAQHQARRVRFRLLAWRLRRAGMVGMRFRPPRRSLCHAAARIAGCWEIDALPAFPPGDCEERGGCRCRVEPIDAHEARRIVIWWRA